MKMTTGFFASASNSDDVASSDDDECNKQSFTRGPILTCDLQNVASPLYDSELEAQTDPEEGNFLFPCVFDGHHHALRASGSKTTRDEDATYKTINLVNVAKGWKAYPAPTTSRQASW